MPSREPEEGQLVSVLLIELCADLVELHSPNLLILQGGASGNGPSTSYASTHQKSSIGVATSKTREEGEEQVEGQSCLEEQRAFSASGCEYGKDLFRPART